MTTAAEKTAGTAFWQEHDGELRRLAAEGLTTAAAGARLGVSKSTVIGRAYRLGVRWAGSPSEAPPEDRDPFPGPGRCVFPLGDPQRPGFAFCAAPAAAGPYCDRHRAVAYQRGTSQV